MLISLERGKEANRGVPKQLSALAVIRNRNEINPPLHLQDTKKTGKKIRRTELYKRKGRKTSEDVVVKGEKEISGRKENVERDMKEMKDVEKNGQGEWKKEKKERNYEKT